MRTFRDVRRLASDLSLVPGQRTILAPASDGPVAPPAVLSVELEEEEDVCWHKTYLPDGRCLVTGYTIIPALSGE